jgi:sugar transferase (PEP-CTERM/EpsH1 system associated)
MAVQKELLFLSHRIPYPPNKGDKIRSFNLLKHLSKYYRIHLGAFVDDPVDWAYKSKLEAFCDNIYLHNIKPLQRRLISLKGLLYGMPLTLPYYFHPKMQQWVNTILTKHPIEAIVIFSSPMAQYVTNQSGSAHRRIVDFVDVDSDKWAQYAGTKSWPFSWIYRREARTLLRYERSIALAFDASIFVSKEERTLFRNLAPESAERCFYIQNGVDTDYFSPDRSYPNPYKNSKILVFTGAMDYWANIDAVCWFAKKVFPEILNRIPEAEFYIVGTRPSSEVQALSKQSGITVTGSVPDVRVYLAHATGAVAPMRIARGVQNKVLEAMSMGLPVLTTPMGVEGIKAEPGVELLVNSDIVNLQNLAIDILSGEYDSMGEAARKCILQNYEWKNNLHHLDELLAGGSAVNRFSSQ